MHESVASSKLQSNGFGVIQDAIDGTSPLIGGAAELATPGQEINPSPMRQQ
jgi:hypothetical protein